MSGGRIPALVLLLGLASCACGGGDESESDGRLATTFAPPIAANLLLVSLDTTRADHLSAYGYELETSPALAALATDGHLFASAWTPMPTTLPAHAALFTSLYPRQLGVVTNQHTLDDDVTTLTEHLAAAGFATAGFAAAQPLSDIDDEPTGLAQGFDHYDHTKRVRDADAMCALALDWIRARGDERFFCFLHFFDAHTDYDPPEPHRSNFGVEAEGLLPGWGHMAFPTAPEGLTPELVDDSARAYDAEIAFADAELGKLLETLAREGVRERTVVCIFADHGETLGELIERYGYAFDHGEFLYPRELRVPLVLWLPPVYDLPRSGVHDEAVSLLDIMPTLLELVGVPCPARVEGRSLVPLFTGGAIPSVTFVAERHTYSKPPNEWMNGAERAMVRDGWLSIHSDGRGEELFDLAADPRAVLDMAGAQAPRLEAMRARLERWLAVKLPVYGAEAAPPGSARDKALSGIGYASGG